MCSSNYNAVYHIINCIYIVMTTRHRDLLPWQTIALGAGGRAYGAQRYNGILCVFIPPPFFFFNKEFIIFFMAFSFVARAGCNGDERKYFFHNVCVI